MSATGSVVGWSNERGLPAVVGASALAGAVLLFGPRLLGLGPTHRFLAWNLTLAWIPYLAALLTEWAAERGHPLAASLLGGLWLLFLPNAPYIVTDLAHLQRQSATPWLDVARFSSFSLAGCLLGAMSIRIVQRVVSRRAGSTAGLGLVAAAALACGVGVAVGRFARLNSWEALTRPGSVVNETLLLASSRQAVAVGGFIALLVLVTWAAVGGTARGPD